MSFFRNRVLKIIKNRNGRIPLIRLFIFLAVFAFVWKIAREHKIGSAGQSQNASVMPMLDPLNQKLEQTIQSNLEHLTKTVKSGDSYFSILSEFGVARDKANDVHNLLKPLGVSSLFPGDSVIVHKNGNGNIKEFSLLSKSLCWYKVNWTDSIVKAQKIPVGVSNYTCLVNGIIESSLSEAMQQSGISDVITGKFADIFGWDINFFTDPRKGDIFQIVFEQKYAEGKFIGYGDILAARYITSSKTFYAFGFKDTDGRVKYFDENGKALQKQFLKAPLRYSRISSGFTFHRLHPILGIIRPHLGIDYAAPEGTPVSASADGKISFAGRQGGFGNLIVVSHGGAYETYYGHLQKILVKTGMFVKQGDEIGTVGATGLATGPHLDYRMKKGSDFVNPNNISLPAKESIVASQMENFNKTKTTFMVAFDKRFTEQIGLQILEIKAPDSAEVTINQICRSNGTSDGHTSGN